MPREQMAHPVHFPSTHWSLVDRAGQVNDQRSQAMTMLLERYLPALRAHLVWGRRLSEDQADDLIQGFVADKVIERNLFADAREVRGRFRSFLLAALNHHVIARFRHDTALKRCPPARMLDLADQLDVAENQAEPSAQFTLVWARQIIAEATRRMEAHCRQVHRLDLWLIFSQRVLCPAGSSSHASFAAQLKLRSSKEAANLLITAKRLFTRMLRLVVGEYAGSEQQIDEEIDDLMRILCEH
jgi:RNA polymerase sigma-70 factor (ECF subfamily)